MKFYSFIEPRKSQIKANSKYMNGYIKEAVIARWGEVFCRLNMLSDGILRFWVGGSSWSTKL